MNAVSLIVVGSNWEREGIVRELGLFFNKYESNHMFENSYQIIVPTAATAGRDISNTAALIKAIAGCWLEPHHVLIHRDNTITNFDCSYEFFVMAADSFRTTIRRTRSDDDGKYNRFIDRLVRRAAIEVLWIPESETTKMMESRQQE